LGAASFTTAVNGSHLAAMLFEFEINEFAGGCVVTGPHRCDHFVVHLALKINGEGIASRPGNERLIEFGFEVVEGAE
jgi:hypothetical protein